MRLVSYGPIHRERAGLSTEQGILDIEAAMRRQGLNEPVSDMRLLLEQTDWRATLEGLEGEPAVDPATVRLGAPVPVPRKLLIAGANTYTHLKEAEPLTGAAEPPRLPMILGKATSAIAGPTDDIVLPPETGKLDYEVELGVVIGRTARRISADDVKDHVAGFLVVNEVSARDIQLAEHEEHAFFRAHYMGKSFDSFAPMGPALVTTDEFTWGEPFKMRTLVNGEVRQDGDTTDLCHGIETLVAYCSSVMTLFPGDIISTGSPAGVAFFMNPPGFLKHGDVVRCEIDGVGVLENRVTAEHL